MPYPIRRFEYAAVVHVVDGDTCDIAVDLGYSVKVTHRFRLARINTPERGQQGWNEARLALHERTAGRNVVLDVTKLDKYGRYLAELTVDGININDLLLSEGLAQPYGL